MKKRLALLGSTGSIGTQTIDVVLHHPEECSITCLAAFGSRAELLARQIETLKPSLVVVYDESRLDEVYRLARAAWTHDGRAFPEFVSGMDGLLYAVRHPEVDMVVTSLVGMIGIEPTVEAIKAGKDIALANKETLVCAGGMIMSLAEKHGVGILPIDSEHGAVFQCMQNLRREDVSRIWLTASGGPFRGYTREQLKNVTLEQALRHPNWSMGRKITVDSATLMNKGLEMLESSCLWGIGIDRVVPVVHKESIIHSMVETVDSSVLAQLGPVDMRLPIEVVLLHPKRGKALMEPLDFTRIGSLTFEPVDEEAFPSVAMAREAGLKGGLMPCCFNAANEVAVERFMKREISFTEIFEAVKTALARCEAEYGAKEAELSDMMRMKDQVEKWL